MSLPLLRSVKQWLPMIGGGFFMTWVVLLVILSLFAPEPPAAASKELTDPERRPQRCVAMPGGYEICDELPEQESTSP